jgi:hypothetical protein
LYGVSIIREAKRRNKVSNDLEVYEQRSDLAINRAPETVLAEAKMAAKSLTDVIANKKKPVIFNGEQYLEFEDWQTVGRFYGVTAKVMSTEYVDFGGVVGFQARAVIVRQDGMEISAAEAMCLSDEPNWSKKPLFQLRSMAQTRACAKALRNVLAWVVVLAGYKATPAEEMTGNEHTKPPIQKPQEKGATPAPPSGSEPVINEKQAKRFYAIGKSTGATDDTLKAWLLKNYGFDSSKKITLSTYDDICEKVLTLANEPGSNG